MVPVLRNKALKFRFYMYIKEELYTWTIQVQYLIYFLRLIFLRWRLNRRISQKNSTPRKIQLYGISEICDSRKQCACKLIKIFNLLRGISIQTRERRNDLRRSRMYSSMATKTKSTNSNPTPSAKMASHKARRSCIGNSLPNSNLIQRL